MAPTAAGESGQDGRPLRILLFTHYFWPESFRINQMVEDLIAAGADVTVLTGQPSYPEGKTYPGYAAWRTRVEDHPAGYRIFRVPVVPRGSGSAVRLALNYLSFVASGIGAGGWLLRGKRFDILFNYCTTPAIQGFVGVALRPLNGGKLVLWVQDLWPQALSATGFIHSPLLLRWISRVVSALYRRADLILGQSKAFVRHIAPAAGSTPVDFFPNPGEHPPSTAVAGPRLPEKFNVVFAGNLGKAQALDNVVGAAALLAADPEIHITLFGSGSKARWVADEASKRGLSNLTLGGRMPPEAMPGIYAQSSVLLLTLVNDPVLAQTVPSKLQSYFATGKPIVAAVNGEAAEIVAQSGAGLACPAGDPEALADALRTLKAMPEAERAALGAAACRFFETHYKPDVLARELVAKLRRLASDSGEFSRHAQLARGSNGAGK